MRRCMYCNTELTDEDVVATDRDGWRVYKCSKCQKKQ